jgi:hypothetical protein
MNLIPRNNLLQELALVQRGVQQENDLHGGLLIKAAEAFDQVTQLLVDARWLLKDSKTSLKVDAEIETRLIRRLREFRLRHLTPATIAA